MVRNLDLIPRAKGGYRRLLSKAFCYKRVVLAGVWRIDWKVMVEEAQLEAISVNQVRDRGVSPDQCLTDLSGHQSHLEGPLKHSLLAPPPEFLIE